MNSYYNTNNESGQELEQSIQQAETQQEAILLIFKRWNKLTASEAWNVYDSTGKTPITSIRRAITNLCYDGELVKSEDTKTGIYGKDEHIYKLVKLTTKVDKNGQLFF